MKLQDSTATHLNASSPSIMPQAGTPAFQTRNEFQTSFTKTPLRFFTSLLVIVFVGETLVMVVLPALFPHGLTVMQEAFLDSSLLAMTISPVVWLLLIRPLRSDATRLAGLNNLLAAEINERKSLEQRLKYFALHDSLTGLPNRAFFIKQLERAIMRRRTRENYRFAVLFIDLDRFKAVNDSLGHVVGDLLLVSVAKRLEGAVRPGDMVARLGGDEFIVLVEVDQEEDAARVAQRILEQFSLPFALAERKTTGVVKHHEVYMTASIGIIGGGTPSGGTQQLLTDADIAMYRAKSRGRGCFEVFDATMHKLVLEKLQLENDLQRAVQGLGSDGSQFFLNYQPIVSLRGGRLIGFEALLRWRHPDNGLVPPDKFIPVAEEMGVIGPLGSWVLEEACRQMSEWSHPTAGAPDRLDQDLFIAVNFSGKQLLDPDCVAGVSSALHAANLPPHRLKIEITESVAMHHVHSTAAVLNALKALGVELSIDDFGTGYSSLSYLHTLPFNNLKIDRAFVDRLSCDNQSSHIVDTITKLAHNLGMTVIAEGVETEEQKEILQRLGCESVQGYLLSRPLGKDEAQQLLKSGVGGHEKGIPVDVSAALVDESSPVGACEAELQGVI